VLVERGDKLWGDFGPRGRREIEQFGHRDGISNPRMFRAEAEEERLAQGADHWDPEAPLALVLTPDGAGHGSYFVFRKLEQDVAAFRAYLARQRPNDRAAQDKLAAARQWVEREDTKKWQAARGPGDGPPIRRNRKWMGYVIGAAGIAFAAVRAFRFLKHGF